VLPPCANCCLLEVQLIFPPFVGASILLNRAGHRSLRADWLCAENSMPKGALHLGTACAAGDYKLP
jgi:hypothetical protein